MCRMCTTPAAAPAAFAGPDYPATPNASLLQALIAEQSAAHWISPAALAPLAARHGATRAQAAGVVSFYEFLTDSHPARYRLLFSDDAVDRQHGSAALLEQLCRLLWIEPDHTSEDGLVHVARTSSLGFADLAPTLSINGRSMVRVDAERITAIATLISQQTPLDTWPATWFADARPLTSVQARQRSLADDWHWSEALHTSAALAPAQILEHVTAAGLRGHGGAGFPTGHKWTFAQQAALRTGLATVVVANADEGEPGTFKDRVLLTEFPERLFTGMAVAARATGARRGFLYLRGEYVWLQAALSAALVTVQAHPDWPAAFSVAIHLGAGAYVCGEESALIESLEGHRGIPRNRPPYPAESGYQGHPTTVNNVETLVNAAWLMAHSVEHFRRLGTADSPGTLVLSVAGDCAHPGVYELEYGVTVAHVLAACGATNPLAVQISGPSGTLVERSSFTRRLCFADLPCNGAFTIFDHRRDIFEIVRGYSHFFARESCGFCTPCRVGTRLLARSLDKIAAGHGTRHEIQELRQLESSLRTAAHCGLGQSAGRALTVALKQFWPAFERRLKSHAFEPAFDLDGALARARQMTGRDDAGAHLSQDES